MFRYPSTSPFLRTNSAPTPLITLQSGPRPWIQWRLPRSLAWTQIHLPLRDLPLPLSGLRLLHLSDLHLKPHWAPAYDELIEKTVKDPPDLILVTGDFVDYKFDHRPALPTLRHLVGSLKSTHGTYAVLGNHDPDVVALYVQRLGVTCITHRRLTAPTEHGDVELIGLPGASRRDLDPEFLRTLPPRQPGLPRIVLSHFPDLIVRALPLDPDLYLAGHTHGGQICLPNGWPPLTHDRMPRRFAKGLHRFANTWYSVSTGIGLASILPLRLFCPSEVTEFVLRAREANEK